MKKEPTYQELQEQIRHLQQENNALKKEKAIREKQLEEGNTKLELFFRQSMMGFFFMMLDEPIEWNENTDKEKALDYIFEHQKVTKINKAMLEQYGAKEEDFIGLTPKDFFEHDIEHGKKIWRDFFDKGHLKVDTHERKFDGSEIQIKGDYICLYDDKGKITGHFGVQREVTEERKAANRLKESEAKFKSYFDNNPDGVFITNEKGEYLEVNSAACKMTGYSKSELLKMSVSKITHEDSASEAQKHFQEVIRYGKASGELAFKAKSNEKRFWSIDAIKISENRLLGFKKDITERKQAKKALLKSKEKAEESERKLALINEELSRTKKLLEQAGEVANIGAWEFDIIENINIWSKTTYEIHEAPADFEPHPKKGVAFYKEGYSRDKIIEVFTKCVQEGVPFDEELQLVTYKGNVIWVRAIGVAEMKDGKCVRVYGTFQNIQEAKVRQEMLKQSLKDLSDYKHALNQSSIVSITDRKGTITYTNDNFCNISKFKREELIGKNHRLINSGHHPKELWVEMWATIMQGQIWRGEIKNKAKDGAFYWVDTFIIPFTNEQGKITQYMSIRYDITGKKAKEEETILQNQALKKANSELDNFVYSVSHDLRAPITSSLGLTDLCLMLEPKEEVSKYLHQQQKSLNKLDRFIQDILNYSRNTRLEVSNTPINFEEFIEGIISQHNSQSPSVEIRINVEGDDTLISDETRLTIIFNNLISNAFKFVAPYKDDSFIEIHAEILDKNAIIRVSDNGIGIQESHLEKIFNMFYRATDKNYGSGLGLYIAREAIQKIGGKIYVESTYGEGTTFTLSLPNHKG